MRMTRRVTFSASYISGLHTYGSNFVLDVTVTGAIEAKTGIVVNIKEIDHIVRTKVIEALENTVLNQDAGPLAGTLVTCETLLALIRTILTPYLPPTVSLAALRLENTPLDAVEWTKSNSELHRHSDEMLSTRVYEFSASHRLYSSQLSEAENWELFGKCSYANGHGHNYVLEVTVSGPIDPQSCRVIDPQKLDALVNTEVVDRYDHRHLNLDFPEFADSIPSSEIVTKTIWNRIEAGIVAPAKLHKVVLRETPRNFFEYCGEDK